jgi:hypothetical protein
MKLAKCARCKINYPAAILNPVHTDKGVTGEVCGICALEMSNEIHGIHRKRFDGEVAEHMRQQALAWRRQRQ